MSFNWKGQLYLDITTEDHKHLSYVMKLRGWFNRRIELINRANQHILLTMHSESNWFTYNYQIEAYNPHAMDYPFVELLGILAVGATLIRNRENEGC